MTTKSNLDFFCSSMGCPIAVRVPERVHVPKMPLSHLPWNESAPAGVKLSCLVLAEHQAQTNVWMWFPCFVQLSEEGFVLEAHQPKFGELPRAQSALGEGLLTSSVWWNSVAPVVQNTAAPCNIRAFYVHSKSSILQGNPFSFLPQAPQLSI